MKQGHLNSNKGKTISRRKRQNLARKTKRKKTLFLSELRETGGEVLVAADRVGISKTAIYRWRAEDPAFSQLWDEAIDLGWGDFKATGFERAKNKSDALWILLARAKWPAEYNERVEHEIKNNETFKRTINALGQTFQRYIPKAQQAEAVRFFGDLMGAVPRTPPEFTEKESMPVIVTPSS